MNFKDLPDFPPLFVDYVQNAPGLRAFFSAAPSMERVRDVAFEVRKRDLPRLELSRMVAAQADLFAAGVRSLENIQKLRDPATVLVLATIGPSVFGGPVSELLNCLTAVKLARQLEANGIQAIPVCRIADKQVLPIRLLDSEAKVQTIESVENATHERITEIAGLEHRQYAGETAELLRRTYPPTADLAVSSGRLFSALLGEHGLVIYDARLPEIRLFGSGSEARRRAEREVVIHEQRSRLTGAGYSVPKDPLGSEGDLFPLADELGVLPVAAYVMNPAETYTLALMFPLLRESGLADLPVWPRISSTIIDARSRRTMEKHSLEFSDLLGGADTMISEMADLGAARQAIERLSGLISQVDGGVSKLALQVPSDDGLRKDIESAGEKIRYQLSKLKERLASTSQTKHEAVERQIRRLCNTLLPGGHLQENELATVQFMLLYSPSLIEILYQKLDAVLFEHQLVVLD